MEFEDGEIAFVDGDADRLVEPKAGRFVAFTSGVENMHVARAARPVAGDGADGSTPRTRIIERSDAVAADTRAASRRAPGGGPAKRRPTMTAPSGGGVPPRPRKKKR